MEWWNVALLALAAVILLCRVLGTHRVLRWPIFLVICSSIALELLAYVFVRLAMSVMHGVSRTRSREKMLEQCPTYAEWQQQAAILDADEARDQWRMDPRSPDYDWRHVQAHLERMRAARQARDWGALMSLLAHALKKNAFGEHEPALYAHARTGTKHLLEHYRDEVCRSLRALSGAPSEHASAIHAFFLTARASLGSAALVLSGGALFGVFHFGILKALLDFKMLPSVVCGASAGAVVAAVACTRTDDELAHILADKTALFREMGSDG